MHLSSQIRILSVLCFLLGPALAKDAAWIKLRSDNFEIYSAESEKKARQVLEHLERVRKAYGLLTNVTVESEEPIRVVLFRNEKEYREYAWGQFSAAYYMSARGRDHIVLSDFTADTERVLNHEYFHLFSKHAGFRFPVWLEEGLADLYSTLKITSKDVSVAHPIENHIRFLNSYEGRPLPLAQITAVNHENRHDSDRRATSLLYAQGWALTHMTFHGKEMSARSQMFFQTVRNGDISTELAYRMVYGRSLEQIDQSLAEYVKRSSYYYGKSPAEGLDFTAPTSTVSAEDWETPLLLADLLAYTKKTEAAKARYEELARQFPGRPEVEESRGYLAIHNGDVPGAIPYFRAAAAKKSTNAKLYYDLAATSCNYYQANDDCRNWINESLRLKPDDKQAREWAIGYALNTRQFQSALIYMARGGKVTSEEAPRFFEKMAYAHYQLNNFSEARASVKRGLEYAKKPEEQTKLQALANYIDQAEQLRNGSLASAEYAPAAESSSNEANDANEAQPSGEAPPTLRRRNGPSAASSLEAQSDADRAIEQFIMKDGAILTAATLDQMDCTGASPVLAVKAKNAPLRLLIDNPSAVYVIRTGELVVDYEFVCGRQKPLAVMVGYVKEGASGGADGLLRILSFR